MSAFPLLSTIFRTANTDVRIGQEAEDSCLTICWAKVVVANPV